MRLTAVGVGLRAGRVWQPNFCFPSTARAGGQEEVGRGGGRAPGTFTKMKKKRRAADKADGGLDKATRERAW